MSYASVSARSDQLTTTSAPAVGGVAGGRSWKQIVEDAEKKNFLEIKITKTVDLEDGSKPKNLTFDDISAFLFDILKVDYNHCLAFDYSSGRYDSRFIQLKPEVEPTPYLRSEPVVFMRHHITVTSVNNRSTKVTFRNVPLTVPDEELLHLAYHYGTPVNNKVEWETLSNNRNRGMKGSARYIYMNMDKGQSFENYYWMEGPLPGDTGRRVVVTHSGQLQQCSHCFRRAGQGCPAAGNGKNCEAAGTPRAQMKDYMLRLRASTGYVSLKIKDAEAQAKRFPPIYGSQTGFDNMVEDSVDSDGEPIVFMTPIEQKDREIKDMAEENEKIKNENERNKKANEELTATQDDLNKSNKELRQKLSKLRKKVNRSMVIMEQKLVDKLEQPDWNPDTDSGFEVTAMANLLMDEECDTPGSSENDQRSTLLDKVKQRIDPNDTEKNRRFEAVKRKILERRLSLTSAGSSPARGRKDSLTKRAHSGEYADQRERSRPRTDQIDQP